MPKTLCGEVAGEPSRPAIVVERGGIVVEVHRRPFQDWDQVLEDGGACVPTVMATTWWAEYLTRAVFARPWYLAVRSHPDGILLGTMLAFTEYPLGRRTAAWRGARLLAALGHSLYPVLSWSCGPVVLASTREAEVHRALAAAIVVLQERVGIPRVHRAAVRPVDSESLPEVEAAWREAGFAITPVGTLTVDLAPSLDELRAGLQRSAQKCLRRCEEGGVVVARVGEVSGPDLRTYLQAFEACKPAWSRGPRQRLIGQLMWSILGQHGAVELFWAVRGDQPLAGLGLWHHAGYGQEFAAWTSPLARAQGLPGGDALKWAIIAWGKDHGLRWYDLAGIALAPQPGSKEAGIRQFKQKWGGVLHRYLTVSRSGDGMRNRCYARLARWHASRHMPA